jgi:hypothetical protein
VGNIGIVSIYKDPGIWHVLGQEVSWPKIAIAMSPCFERMIVSTTGVQTVDENKTKE